MSHELDGTQPAWHRSVPVPRLVRPQAWLLLGLLLLLLLPAALFGLFGSLPVRVEGRALLLEPERKVGLFAPGEGRLRAYAVETGALVDSGAVVCWLDTPELCVALAEARACLRALEQRQVLEQDAARALTHRQLADLAQQEQQLQAALTGKRSSRLPLYADRQQLLEARSAELQSLLSDTRLQVGELEADADRLQGLLGQGLSARAAVEASERALREARQQLTALATRQSALHLEQQELRASRQETSAELARIEQTLAQLALERLRLTQAEPLRAAADLKLRDEQRRLVARLEDRLLRESCLRAPAPGHILELTVPPGSRLAGGQAVGSLLRPQTGALRALAFLSQVDAQRVAVGQPVLLAVDGLPRARYGSLRAVVEQVSGFPVSAAFAVEQSGHPSLAADLTADGRFITVWLRLEREADAFLWTGRHASSRELASGMLAAARIQVGSRRPIGLLLPRLEDGIEGVLP